jgi:hypothetical protein
VPSLPRNDVPSPIFTDQADVLASTTQVKPLTASVSEHLKADVPLVENAKQEHQPKTVADPLGLQRKEFYVRRRK